MTTQPQERSSVEALRLAEILDDGTPGWPDCCNASTELRRLHEVNQELVEVLHLTNIDCQHLHHAHKDRHALFDDCPVVARITAAIKKATGETK